MAEEVHVPGAGSVDKRVVYVVAAGAAGILLYAWWKHKTATSSATDPSLIDPATGLPYASETSGNTGYVNPNPDASGSDTVSSLPTISTNVQWVAAVTPLLENAGYEPLFIATTLGKYLSSTPLTSDEGVLVQAAWSMEGKPPSGPTTFTLTNTTSTPGSGSGGGDSGGGSGGGSSSLTAPSGVHASVTRTTVTLAWSGVAGAAGYRVYVRSGDTAAQVAGASWAYSGSSTSTSYTLTGATPGRLYDLSVRAVDAAGNLGPAPAGVWIRTPK